MKAVIQVEVVCSIKDQIKLIELARAEVESIKPRDDWELYYPQTATDALMQVIRTSISTRLMAIDVVELHEIGHQLKDLDIPL